MATDNNATLITAEAGADLSAGQFLLVKGHTTANQVVLAGDGENAIGVLYEPAAAAGRAVAVANGGIVRAYAGGSVSVGARVASDAAGKVVTAAAGDYVLGIAKTAGAANAMMEIYWGKNGIEPTP